MASMEKEIKIRRLKISDRKKVSQMLKKIAEVTEENKILKAISSTVSSSSTTEGEDNEESYIDAGVKLAVSLIRNLLDVLEEETHAWFADLINVTPEEFLNLPMDTETIIIDQLVEAKEAINFFTIASRLFNKIGKYQGKLSGAKEK